MLAVVLGVALAPDVPGPLGAWGLVSGGLGGLAALAWVHRLGWRPLAVACGLALGVSASRSVPPGPEIEGVVQLTGVRVGSSLGRSADVALPGGGRVRVRFGGRAPSVGTAVAVLGHAGPVRPVLPGAPDPVRAASLTGVRTEVVAIRDAAAPAPPAPRALHDPTGVLRAVVTGDRTGLDPELVARLRRTGTAHLLAISGFHVSVVAGLLASIGVLVTRVAAARVPAGWPPLAAAGLGVAAAAGYAHIAGAPVSAQRASLVLALVVGGRLLGRRPRWLSILAVAAAVVAAVDPASIATPGYQLSFGAVAGLVTVGQRIAGLLPPDTPRALAWAGRSAAASVGATAGTLPAAAWWFQSLAPLSVLANLVAVPGFGFVVVPAAGLAHLLPEPLSGVAATVGTVAVQALAVGLGGLDVPPLAPAVGPVGAVLLAGALALTVRWPLPGAGAVALVLGWPAPRPDGWRFVFLDVGQGDAALVEHPDGQRWLVDGGRPSRAVLHWLRREGIRDLDVVVVTHPDLDHLGGTLPVIGGLRVGEVWAHEPPEELVERCAAASVPLRAPPDALWPRGPVESSDNAASIVLSVGPLLLLADVDSTVEGELVRRGLRPHPLLKVAHHGSASSTSAALIDAVRPQHAFVSVGRGNRYGHPAPAVLARLGDRGVTVWRTDEHGTVEVRMSGDVPGVSASRGARHPLLASRQGATTQPHPGTVDP